MSSAYLDQTFNEEVEGDNPHRTEKSSHGKRDVDIKSLSYWMNSDTIAKSLRRIASTPLPYEMVIAREDLFEGYFNYLTTKHAVRGAG